MALGWDVPLGPFSVQVNQTEYRKGAEAKRTAEASSSTHPEGAQRPRDLLSRLRGRASETEYREGTKTRRTANGSRTAFASLRLCGEKRPYRDTTELRL